jgi:two-component system, chemotaxis family, chemotaxis protein CheY
MILALPMLRTATTDLVTDKQMPASPRCTIVLADDDTTSRWLLRGLLRRLGFTLVAEATNGVEAVAAVARTKPDLVLLDVCMPLRTGPDALPALINAHPGVKIVMLTSMAEAAIVMDCLEKGAVDYLRKDTPIDEISRVLVGLRNRITAQRACGINYAGSQTIAP